MTTYTINPAATEIEFGTTISVESLQSLGWEFNFDYGLAEVHITGTSNDLQTCVIICSAEPNGFFEEKKRIENSPRIISDVIKLLGNGSIEIEDDYTTDFNYRYVPTFIQA